MNKKEQYAELWEGLRNLPSPKSRNRQAVEDSIDVIDETLGRGVPWEAIVQWFGEKGWDMAVSTFRQYVRDARNARDTVKEDAVVPNSTPPKSDRKRTRERKADGVAAETTGHTLQREAGASSIEADPFDLALASAPELASDESQRLF